MEDGSTKTSYVEPSFTHVVGDCAHGHVVHLRHPHRGQHWHRGALFRSLERGDQCWIHLLDVGVRLSVAPGAGLLWLVLLVRRLSGTDRVGIGDKLKVKIPRRVLLYLGMIPFVALAIKVYSTLLVNWLQGFPVTFTFRLADVEPWGGQQTGVSILITLIMFGPALLFVFGRRAWCRHLCPIGALLKVFSGVSVGKVRLVNDKCIACGKCNRSCDMEVDVMGELETYGEVSSLNCIRCLKCIDVCPNGAIAFSLSHREASLSADAAARARRSSLKRRQLSAFDVAITVLWVGVTLAVTFIAVRQDAPQEVKAFMSPGLLLAIYGLVWVAQKAWIRLGMRKQEEIR